MTAFSSAGESRGVVDQGLPGFKRHSGFETLHFKPALQLTRGAGATYVTRLASDLIFKAAADTRM